MTQLVETGIDGVVATVTLNRPEARNATSLALLGALGEALERVAETPAVRVVVLAGAGPAFCSGLDLHEAQADEATVRALLARLSSVMRRIRRLPLPTIARVQGAAIGGGLGLLAVADFAVTHAEARIGYPPLDTGLSPALMAPWLVRRVGPARARAMLLAGGTISGRAAFRAGLVTHLASRTALAGTAAGLGRELARGGREATRVMKTLLNELDGSMSDEMLDHAAALSADVISSAETRERMRTLFG